MVATLVCTAFLCNVYHLTHDVCRDRRLHYIPLSPSYQEIYNIHAFFSGATESTLRAANSTTLLATPTRRRPVDGDRRLRRIARAGKQWKRSIGRRVDMEGVATLILPCANSNDDKLPQHTFIASVWNMHGYGLKIEIL